MNYINNKHLIIWVLLTSACSYSQTANPTRPSAADNAYLTEYGYSEIEMGFLLDENNNYSLPALLKFTFHPKIEVGLIMSGLVVYDGLKTQLGEPGLQLKYQVFDNKSLAFAIAGKIESFKTSSPKYTVYCVPTIQTEAAQFDLTVGTAFVKTLSSYENSVFYAVAISPKLKIPVGIYGEVFGESFSGISTFNIDFGIAYPVNPDFVIDAAYSFGLGKTKGVWSLQFGFTKTLINIL